MTCAGWRPQHIDVSTNKSALSCVYTAFIPTEKVRHAPIIGPHVCVCVCCKLVFLIRGIFATTLCQQVGDYQRSVLWTTTVEYKTRFRNYRQLYLAPFWAHIEASCWRLLSNRSPPPPSRFLLPVYIAQNGASRREILKPRAGGNRLIIKATQRNRRLPPCWR